MSKKFFKEYVNIIPAAALLLFAAYFTSALIFSVSYAAETSTEVHVSVSNPSDSTISSLGYFVRLATENVVDIDVLPTRGGNIAYNNDNVYVWTNSPSGYQLYVSTTNSAASSQNLYLNGDAMSSHYFAPTTATSLDNDSWGYGLTSDSFSPVPTRGLETQIRKTTASNQYASLDDELTKTPVYYGVKADYDMPVGNYTGTVLYTALAEATESQTPGISISPTALTTFAGGETLTINTSLFTNIDDVGEISVYVGDEVSANLCANPVATASADDTLLITCKLPEKAAVEHSYDVVVNIPKFGKKYTLTGGITYSFVNKIAESATMQSFTSAMCAATTTPAAFNEDGSINANVPQATLSDIRDGESYIVRKLADGNCWMVENLRLGKTNKTYTLTPENTNLASGQTINLENAWSSLNNTFATHTTTSQRIYYGGNKGNYYNWYTTTANNYSKEYAGQTSYSICPKNWVLPSRSNYMNMTQTTYQLNVGDGYTNATKAQQPPLNFTVAGMVMDSVYVRNNEAGEWWTATSLGMSDDGVYRAYRFVVNYTTALASSDSWVKNGQRTKAQGNAVRCVLLSN